MGRKSREKRERSERNTGGLVGALRELDARSVESLLEAAGASPTANHCLPSIAHTFGTLMKHGSPGGRRSIPEDLPILLDFARDADTRIAQLEDYIPYDVTLKVCARWGKALYRMLPGALSRPVAAVQEARLLASCIDPVLVCGLGYGLGDAVELILRRVDHVSTALAPVWMSGQAPNPGDPPLIECGRDQRSGRVAGHGGAGCRVQQSRKSPAGLGETSHCHATSWPRCCPPNIRLRRSARLWLSGLERTTAGRFRRRC